LIKEVLLEGLYLPVAFAVLVVFVVGDESLDGVSHDQDDLHVFVEVVEGRGGELDAVERREKVDQDLEIK